MWRQIIFLQKDLFSTFTHATSLPETVDEEDFFHQINIAQFKVNCGSFSKQYSIYEHRIPRPSFDFKIESMMTGSLSVCICVSLYVCTCKIWATKLGFTTLICAFIHMCRGEHWDLLQTVYACVLESVHPIFACAPLWLQFFSVCLYTSSCVLTCTWMHVYVCVSVYMCMCMLMLMLVYQWEYKNAPWTVVSA